MNRVVCCQLAFFFSMLITISGCGKGDRPVIVTASGRVTMSGVPVEGATVSFQPVSGGRPCGGITDANGVYQITSYEQNDGAPVGEHRVAIIKISGAGASAPAEAAPAEDPSLSLSTMAGPGDEGKGEKQPETIYLVPQKYSNAQTSGLSVTVPDGGSDKLDFELSAI